MLHDAQLDAPLGVPSISKALSMWLYMCVAGYSMYRLDCLSHKCEHTCPVLHSELTLADDSDKHTLLGSHLGFLLVQVCVCVCHHGSNRLSANIQDHLTAGSVLKSVQLELELSSQL